MIFVAIIFNKMKNTLILNIHKHSSSIYIRIDGQKNVCAFNNEKRNLAKLHKIYVLDLHFKNLFLLILQMFKDK